MRQLNKSDVESPERLYYVVRELQQTNLALRRDLETQAINNQKEMAQLKSTIPQGSIIDGLSNGLEAFTKLGIDPLASKKSDLSATIAPGVDDDETAGYGIGSIKIIPTASSEEMWVCMNASKGAAVWKQFTLV
jgi:hypothetical protein